MEDNSFAVSANITGTGIKKYFKTYEPFQAVFELVWNGLDACASRVDIYVQENKIFGLDEVAVADNGTGIDLENIETSFGKFDESEKTDINQYGSNGRGRLSFHKLSNQAIWYTRFKGKDAKLSIKTESIKNCHGDYLEDLQQHPYLRELESGTYVELINFHASLPDLKILREKLSVEFGWFLLLHKSQNIYLNNNKIEISKHHLYNFSVDIENINFEIRIVRWESKPSSEKSYNYLVDTQDKIVDRQLSSFNNKANFYISAFVKSSWADTFDPGEPSLLVPINRTRSSSIWRELQKYLVSYTQTIYEDFLRNYVDAQLNKFEEDGVFPKYAEKDESYVVWKRQNTKEVIRSIYIADPTIFNSLNKKQRKILVRLLDKLLISNLNDSLFEILNSVLELDSEQIKVLSGQLKKTQLEHIISTIDIIQRRENAIQKLKEIMDNHYLQISETPDLQKIIESNTWLFGEQYQILGAEEDSFQKIAKNLRDQVKGIDNIEDSDIAEGAEVKGVQRQVDLFMARKIPYFNDSGQKIFKAVIIEIKRPSIALNKKHLQQLDDYIEILQRHKAFTSDKLKIELILVGRNISRDDFAIKNRLESHKDKGEPGLVTSTLKFKQYVKNWYTIFDEFDLVNSYFLETLNTKREELSESATQDLVSDLQRKTA